MIRRASILLTLLLMMSVAGSYPVHAEFFSNMGRPGTSAWLWEASASALRAIAKVIDAVADLKDGRDGRSASHVKGSIGTTPCRR